jgi:hypothetical protein
VQLEAKEPPTRSLPSFSQAVKDLMRAMRWLRHTSKEVESMKEMPVQKLIQVAGSRHIRAAGQKG